MKFYWLLWLTFLLSLTGFGDFAGQNSNRNQVPSNRNMGDGAALTSLMQLATGLNPEAPAFQPRHFSTAQQQGYGDRSFQGQGQGQRSNSRGSNSSRQKQQNLGFQTENTGVGFGAGGGYDQYDAYGSNSNGSRGNSKSKSGRSGNPNQYFPGPEGESSTQSVFPVSPRRQHAQRSSRNYEVDNVAETAPDTYEAKAKESQSQSNHQRFAPYLGRSNSSGAYRQPTNKSSNWRGDPSDYSYDAWEGDPAPVSNSQDQDQKGGKDGQKMYFFERAQAKLKEEAKKPDLRNQRESMSDQLSKNAYDCMICVEKVRRSQSIWACAKCYSVFHLNCLRAWAKTSADEVGWRCPGCQTYSEEVPSDYFCFCGHMKNPPANRTDVPHSCGQTCGREWIGGVNCIHSCTIQCHPGPCPPCEAILTRTCCCGKTNAQVKCSSKAVMTCKNNCDKLLNCGVHTCTRPCHGGDCDPCSVIFKLDCYCGSMPKDVICTAETAHSKNYSCEKPCKKSLNCGKHLCEDPCHPGLCKPCKMSPEAVICCPCGQTPITEVCAQKKIRNRVSCLDPIPTCGKGCKKILPCGEPGSRHKCQAECHLDPQCPPCPLKTPVKCRCGNKKFEIPCKEFNPSDDVLCEKKCTKKRNCGRHKCNTKCCIDHDHLCPIVCDRQLRCGNHRCTTLCHNGHCPPCRSVSFEELACECGTSVIYPPVACGTKPPMCQQPCPREHDCDHPVLHTCHSDPTCPPCTVLMPKWCNGNHELRKNVMCHIKAVSCGSPCGKVTACGKHKCQRSCHPGECQIAGDICKLPCEARRKDCGHPCGAPCHEGPCPDTKCKLTTDVSCDCGRKKETMICWKREKEYDRLVFYLSGLETKRLAERKATDDDNDLSREHEAKKDENGVLISVKNKTPKTNILECDKECARIERNRKMVEALQLEDPDVSTTFGTPNYSDFLVGFAKKNPQFVEMVHQRLTSLVLKARKSKRKNETYGFESMNRDKRHVVHEYSVHFGCLSESFDEEPNRNVICTASKEKSYCPSVSLVDAVFRPNLKSERKNAYNDVEVFQNSKSQIMRPANGKILLPARSGSGMVALSGPTTSAWQSQPSLAKNMANGDFPPL